ncbi:MAG TPA: cation diffusion facilitator family transporter [Gemmatimonadaceae bacterium]|nr:cation diffusion facilitator family transporter [Gemmatimonadaceae bacterium]HPV76464.1 cation diffusion facilitator family transporter [Gemmatimonadaceae bacterium]
MTGPPHRGIQTAQLGLLINTGLALVKFVAGILGNSYALIADAVESTSDILSSAIVWGGIRIASREADDDFPFGYGKAEALAGAIVALMLLAASVGISIEAIREIHTPHHAPAPFTLIVLVAVVLVKETLFRRVFRVGEEEESIAVKSDAWHHRSDAITSVAAFIGISIALWKGEGWESADDWAALVAALVIAINALILLRPAVFDLMDRAPEPDIVERVRLAALAVPDVMAIEKLKVRRAGTGLYVDLHVQSDPNLSLHAAHIVSGKVKSAIRGSVGRVHGVLIHMEPFEGKLRKT